MAKVIVGQAVDDAAPVPFSRLQLAAALLEYDGIVQASSSAIFTPFRATPAEDYFAQAREEPREEIIIRPPSVASQLDYDHSRRLSSFDTRSARGKEVDEQSIWTTRDEVDGDEEEELETDTSDEDPTDVAPDTLSEFGLDSYFSDLAKPQHTKRKRRKRKQSIDLPNLSLQLPRSPSPPATTDDGPIPFPAESYEDRVNFNDVSPERERKRSRGSLSLFRHRRKSSGDSLGSTVLTNIAARQTTYSTASGRAPSISLSYLDERESSTGSRPISPAWSETLTQAPRRPGSALSRFDPGRPETTEEREERLEAEEDRPRFLGARTPSVLVMPTPLQDLEPEPEPVYDEVKEVRMRSAGALFGRSLLNELEERKAAQQAKKRAFTGDGRIAMLNGPMLASSPADDREPFARLAAAVNAKHVSADPVLERELAKLAQIRAMEEAERKMAAERQRIADATLAEKQARKAKRKTAKLTKGKAKAIQRPEPPSPEQTRSSTPLPVLPNPEMPTTRESLDFDVMAYGDDGFGEASDEEPGMEVQAADRSSVANEPPALTIDLGNSIGRKKRNDWFSNSDSSDDDEDATTQHSTSHLPRNFAESDSEDDKPIAAVVQKRLTTAQASPHRPKKVSKPVKPQLGRLSLDFGGPVSTLGFGFDNDAEASSDDDAPLNRFSTLHPVRRRSSSLDEDDRPLGDADDLPLGAVHPAAAAQQQYEAALAQQQQQFMWAAAAQQQQAYFYAMAAAAAGYGPTQSVVSGAASGPPGGLADMGIAMPMMPANPALVNSVSRWAHQVPIGGAGSTASSRS